MKKLWLICLFPLSLFALEYEVLFENEEVIVSKWKMLSKETMGLHRNPYPRIVYALQGGTITRGEEDGAFKEIDFPTGVPVYLEADPPGQKHTGANNTDQPIEAIMMEYKSLPKGSES